MLAGAVGHEKKNPFSLTLSTHVGSTNSTKLANAFDSILKYYVVFTSDLPVKMYIIDDLKTRLIVVVLEVTRITITTLRGAAVGILAVDTAPIEEILDHPAALDIPKNGIPPMTDGSTLLILPPPQDPWVS